MQKYSQTDKRRQKRQKTKVHRQRQTDKGTQKKVHRQRYTDQYTDISRQTDINQINRQRYRKTFRQTKVDRQRQTDKGRLANVYKQRQTNKGRLTPVNMAEVPSPPIENSVQRSRWTRRSRIVSAGIFRAVLERLAFNW